MDHAAHGAEVLSSDPLLALTHYTKALIEHPESPDYYVQRSTAFTRLKPPHGPRYDLALQDAELSVLLGKKRAKREKIQAAQQRRVVALFGLQRYGDAAMVLESMVKWRGKDDKKDQMEGLMWKSKIEQRINACDPEKDADKLRVAVEEYPEMELPSEDELKSWLQSQLDDEGKFQFEEDQKSMKPRGSIVSDSAATGDPESHIGNIIEITSHGADESSESIPTNEIKIERSASVSHSLTSPTITGAPRSLSTDLSTLNAAPALVKVRHEWYQSPQTVTLTIYAKNVPKDKTGVEIEENSIFVSFPHPSNPSTAFNFSLDPLFAPIDPSTSKYSVMSTKVELTLQKKEAGKKWATLEGSDSPNPISTIPSTVLAQGPSKSTGPSYPTSSKSGPKNWDKLAADLEAKGKEKKAKKDKKKDKQAAGDDDEDEAGDDDEDSGIDSDVGGDPVDGFFKKLYAGADPDTRRAMMKSYVESGGTALSTNWSEVGKGKVEPVDGSDKK